MDMGLNVSESETFSIGSADLVTHGVPMVTSAEVPWVHPDYQANPNDVRDIVRRMQAVSRNPRRNLSLNMRGLRNYVKTSRYNWSQFLSTVKDKVIPPASPPSREEIRKTRLRALDKMDDLQKVEANMRLVNLGLSDGIDYPRGTTASDLDEAYRIIRQERLDEIYYNRLVLGIEQDPANLDKQ
jgi:hypothetical protein